MILKVFSVYDSKVEAYMTPFFMHSKGQAIRSFMDTIADSNTQFAKHPEDFTLFLLGDYDDQTGKFVMSATPMSCGTAVELLPK